MKRALITGITGMDGSHMADLLLDKNYVIFGLQRRTSTKTTENIAHILNKINILHGDLTDQFSLNKAIEIAEPDEVYNFAAQSFVEESFNSPEFTSQVNGLGVLRILEAIRSHRRPVKFYQASTSEIFGLPTELPQTENTKFHPRSPYGVAKLFGHWITKNYREAYGMFNVCGIGFNHESERRGYNFVTRKITMNIARIKLGLSTGFSLGWLGAKRDWGYSPDYVRAMWLMLQQDEPDDYIIATGESHTVKEFLEKAFVIAELGDWRNYITTDKNLYRPSEVPDLLGDPSKTKDKLDWSPKVGFEEMINIMIEKDIERLESP